MHVWDLCNKSGFTHQWRNKELVIQEKETSHMMEKLGSYFRPYTHIQINELQMD